MGLLMNDDIENEKWVLQRLSSSVQKDKLVMETWQTVSRPLPYQMATARLAKRNNGAHLHRLLTGVECSLKYRSIIQDTVSFLVPESVV